MLTFFYWIIITVRNFKRIRTKNTADNIPAIAGHSAFFILLSLIPFSIFTLSVLSMAGVPKSFLDDFIHNNLSGRLAQWVEEYFDNMYATSAGVAVTTIIAALWSSGKGVYTVSSGVRAIYGFKESGNWLLRRIISMLYTVMLVVLVLLMIGIAVADGIFDEYVRSSLGDSHLVLSVLYSLKYVIAFILAVFLLNLMLFLILRKSISEKKYVGFLVLLPGSALTALCWLLLTFGFQIYINYFNGFSVYMSLGGAAILMMWIYFMMYIFLFCTQVSCMFKTEIYEYEMRFFNRIKKRRSARKKSKEKIVTKT